MSFSISWLVCFAVALALTIWVGRAAKGNVLGILIDSRGRFSLTNLQLTTWTLLILSTFAGGFFASFETPEIPQTLLMLLGMSAGGAVVSTAVKAGKDLEPKANVARAGVVAQGADSEKTIPPRLSQAFLEEEGSQADEVVNISKFQHFLFAAVLAVVYVVLTFKSSGFPDFPSEVLWLLGVSHAGHIGGKVPNKP